MTDELNMTVGLSDIVSQFYIKFDNEDVEIIQDIAGHKINIELDNSNITTPEITFKSKTGKVFTIGLRRIS